MILTRDGFYPLSLLLCTWNSSCTALHQVWSSEGHPARYPRNYCHTLA